jgi:hypothetical protein
MPVSKQERAVRKNFGPKRDAFPRSGNVDFTAVKLLLKKIAAALSVTFFSQRPDDKMSDEQLEQLAPWSETAKTNCQN